MQYHFVRILFGMLLGTTYYLVKARVMETNRGVDLFVTLC